MDAVVILPDHSHCIWTLPQVDADFSTRWNMLKGYFSRHIAKEQIYPAHFSSHRCVEQGVYPENWGNHEGYDIEGLE
ncbi:hypothetical protein [Nitrosomonas sp.]|uniref:hypothetical protein n=1 Tax=Nitrosomonas sp. TaxID=42353 RepID=UPI002730CD9C|nr:hypothetical protein [Nitrosomonas sp.]